MDRRWARQQAEELVGQMTVEEVITQLRYNSPAVERLGIPAYNWWGEALHGVARAGTATSFPQAIGLGATFDAPLMKEIGNVISTEGRAKYNAYSSYGDRDIYKGLTFWSPNINIFRDPRWGRGQETYGEDPYLTGELGTSFVQGVQGDDEEHLKAAACAKHFAAHSGPEGIRHSFNVVASKKDLAETYLPAFEKLVKKGKVEAVMGTYNRLNGVPTSGSKWLIQETLREKWGFEGHALSDCWAIMDFHLGHKVTKTPEESAAMAMNAGCDLNCGSAFLSLLDAYRQGMVKEERLREAAVRLFTTRYLLGLFEDTEYDEIPYTVVECKEHLALAKRAALESTVLLKNDGILPLDLSKIKTIGVVGPNANSRIALVGNYHGTATQYVTPLEGILKEVGEDVRILYSEGCHIRDNKVENLAMENDRLSEAMIVADHSDVVIVVVGLNETLEGEEGDTGNSYASGDKLDLLLPPSQRALLSAMAECGKPVICILEAGSCIDLSFAEENFSAILDIWYPGAGGGLALADILFGKAAPSGKLPVTFYRDEDPLPDFENYDMKGRTYRYLEKAPLYPFGYGLTYGDCEVSEAVKKDAYTLEVEVRNVAEVDAQEVVQVYVACEGPDAPKNPRLCGFARVKVPAKGKACVSVTLDEYTYTVVNEEGERIGTEGARLYAGLGQPDERTFELTGKKGVWVD